MKLELKHLAPYLPYKLKLIQDTSRWFESIGNQVVTLKGLNYFVSDEISWFTIFYKVENEEKNINGNSESIDFKPILRPLSDLTKEIEVNGEKFVPAQYLNNKWKETFVDKFPIPNYTNIDDVCVFYPYVFVNKLFEWHFDVFGLIPEGLAININTLNI